MSAPQYKYYVLGNTVPVRVTFNASGLKLGAEIPNRDTKALEIRVDMLSRLEQSPEVDEVDQVTFEMLCNNFYLKKKSEPGIAPG